MITTVDHPKATRSAAIFRHGISVVLPAHNEEAVIEDTLLRCMEALPMVTADYELIVVDDGSTDRTGAIAEAISATDSHLKVVHNHPNRGYGGALKAGFEVATRDYTFFMDSDGQFDIIEIARLVALIDHGYRAVLGYRSPRRDPLMRLANAWGWNLLIRSLFGLRVHDIDCAFKIYDTAVLRAMEVVAEGATINAEMLIKMQRMGVRYAEVRVTHYPRLHGSASGASVKVILRAFRELLALRERLQTWSATAPVPRTVIAAPARAEELAIGVS